MDWELPKTDTDITILGIVRTWLNKDINKNIENSVHCQYPGGTSGIRKVPVVLMPSIRLIRCQITNWWGSYLFLLRVGDIETNKFDHRNVLSRIQYQLIIVRPQRFDQPDSASPKTEFAVNMAFSRTPTNNNQWIDQSVNKSIYQSVNLNQ